MNQQTMVWAACCLIAVGVAVLWPRAARRGFGAFFILMALGVNVMTAILAPAGFVGLGADAPLLRPYAWAFENLVAAAPVMFGLIVAAYEVLVGILMIRGGRAGQWGLWGGIAFLVVSSPLSTWTLPNLVFAAALAIVLANTRTTGGQDSPDTPHPAPTAVPNNASAMPSAHLGG